ncbi:MAG: hypothetical protein JW892_04035, partial [Anaerolineae bacterium]|nr:hypothetical protein [Anaerolineae bacterium]
MKMKTNVRGLVLSLIALCLVPWALIAAWVWLNVTIVATSPWLDALFGVALILWMITRARAPAAWLAQWRAGRWGSWLYLALAIMNGLSYVVQITSFPLSLLPEILDWPLRLLMRASNLLVQLRQDYQSGIALPQSKLLLLSLLAGLTFLLPALAVVLAGRVVWASIRHQSPLRPVARRAHLLRLPLRAGRILAWLRRVSLGGLVVVVGLAAIQNSTAPQIRWQLAAAAPSAPPSVLALALDGRDGTLYAGTGGGGVFVSRDGGASWQAASAGLTNTDVRALALDGREGTLYAGTQGGGVFVSRDGGASWQAASAGLTNTDVRALALDG